MIAQQFDFSHISDEELFNPERLFWADKKAENDAWVAEQKRRTEAKRVEQERLEQERYAKFMARKATIEYSEALAHELVERVAGGEFLTLICEDAHMPTMRNCTQWLRKHTDFAALYKQAIDDRLNRFEDEMCTIADCSKADYKVVVKNGKEKRVHDPEVIARAKLRIDARFKHLKAYRPTRWGEQSTLNVKDVSDDFDPASMSNSDLEKMISEIEHKSKIAKVA